MYGTRRLAAGVTSKVRVGGYKKLHRAGSNPRRRAQQDVDGCCAVVGGEWKCHVTLLVSEHYDIPSGKHERVTPEFIGGSSSLDTYHTIPKDIQCLAS